MTRPWAWRWRRAPHGPSRLPGGGTAQARFSLPIPHAASALLARTGAASAAAFISLCLAAVPARAADNRPSESEMFGGPPSPGPGTGGAGGSGVGGAPGGAAPNTAPGTPSAPAAVPSSAPAAVPSSATAPAGPSPGDSAPSAAATPSGRDAAAAPAAASPSDAASAPGGGSATSRDTDLLGDPNAGPRLSQTVAPEDPLKIGGLIYLRALSQATEDQSPQDIRFSAPSLVDAYFDARPNERVRGFVLGRLQFDSTLPTVAPAPGVTLAAGGGPSVPLVSGTQTTRGPTVILDQLWLRFDILNTVFVTSGRQHVKWGTGHFWTPTDYLNPQRRNPVAVFDARPGFTMLKLHVPWEKRGWNFYLFGLSEGTKQLNVATGRYVDGTDGAGTLGQIGTAARAEVVLGTAELGLDAVLYRGHKPKFGGDLSFGIGDFDLYADVGLRYGSEVPRRGYNPDPVSIVGLSLDDWVDQKYPLYYSVGVKPQIAAGGTYSLKYNDNDVFTVTGEYFYNTLGYDDPRVYPGLFLTNTFEFFYTGRHYAALAAIAAAPWSWNYTTFTLTTLGNFSDQSFITRLDYAVDVLTHLRFEAFGAVNYGRPEGEFRLGVSQISLPADPAAADQRPRLFHLAPQAFSLGVGLRISI